jgi:hypothetical protein
VASTTKPRRRTLLDALDDPTLFGPLFPSPDWDAWRVFCQALTGAPILGAALDLFRACTGRTTPPTAAASEAWVVCGRRSGKSTMAAAIATYQAALAPTHTLRRGEWGTVLVCAVDKEQAKVVFHHIQGLFEVPALRGLVVNETAEAIELQHRVRILVRSSNFRRVRGVTLLAAILDEVAFLHDEASALPDVELYRALKPALATTKGLLIGISSPWAQRGLLWAKYRKHYAQDGSTLVWQAPTGTMNPTLDTTVITDALEDDPEGAASEYQAEFRRDLESYVSLQVLDACTTPGVVERTRLLGLPYVAFLDPSAGKRDAFALAICHGETHGDTTVAVVDCVREVLPPFDPYAVAGELAGTLRAYGLREAQSDRFAGAWVTDAFLRHGIVVSQDAVPKSELYVACLPFLMAGRVELLDMPKLRTQLAGLERRRRAGGRDVVDHVPGARDDLANAVVGAVLRAINVGVGWWTQPMADGERMGANAERRRERVANLEHEFFLMRRDWD